MEGVKLNIAMIFLFQLPETKEGKSEVPPVSELMPSGKEPPSGR